MSSGESAPHHPSPNRTMNSAMTLELPLPVVGEAAAQTCCGVWRSTLSKWIAAVPLWLWIFFLVLLLLCLIFPCCIFACWELFSRRGHGRRRGRGRRRDQVHVVHPSDVEADAGAKGRSIFYTPPVRSFPSEPATISPAAMIDSQAVESRERATERPISTVPHQRDESKEFRRRQNSTERFGDFGSFAAIPLAREEDVFRPSRRLSDPYPCSTDYLYQYQPHSSSPYHGEDARRQGGWVEEHVEEEEYIAETIVEPIAPAYTHHYENFREPIERPIHTRTTTYGYSPARFDPSLNGHGSTDNQVEPNQRQRRELVEELEGRFQSEGTQRRLPRTYQGRVSDL